MKKQKINIVWKRGLALALALLLMLGSYPAPLTIAKDSEGATDEEEVVAEATSEESTEETVAETETEDPTEECGEIIASEENIATVTAEGDAESGAGESESGPFVVNKGLVYNKTEQELFNYDHTRIEPRSYKIVGEETEYAWNKEIQSATNAGLYHYEIAYYENGDKNNPKFAIVSAQIEKAEPEIIFFFEDENVPEDISRPTDIVIDSGSFSIRNVRVKNKLEDNEEFHNAKDYDLTFANAEEENDEIKLEDIASLEINQTNYLPETGVILPKEDPMCIWIEQGGYALKLTAHVEETENYKGTERSEIIRVTEARGALEEFEKKEIDYLLKTNSIMNDVSAIKKYIGDNGTISYEIGLYDENSSEEIPVQKNGRVQELEINVDKDGFVKYQSPQKLQNALLAEPDQTLSLVVCAKKNKGMGTDGNGETYVRYAEDSVYYLLHVKHLPYEEGKYSIVTQANDAGWYNSPVEFAVNQTAVAEGYQIQQVSYENNMSVQENPGTSLIYGEDNTHQGESKIGIQLLDKGGCYLGAPQQHIVKIDTVAPGDVSISYENGHRYHNSVVKVTFAAKDETSGVKVFSWAYMEGDTIVKSGTVSAWKQGNHYEGSFYLPEKKEEQLYGNLVVTAEDYAGNTTTFTDEGILIVDTIKPEITATVLEEGEEAGSLPKPGENTFYSGDIKVTVRIKEANFVKEGVSIRITKDGAEYHPGDVKFSKVTEEEDLWEGSFLLSADGDYQIVVGCSDICRNEADKLESGIMTIDTVAPVMTSSYDAEAQSITLFVTEHNFRSELLTISGKILDINGVPMKWETEMLEALNGYFRSEDGWLKEGDTYSKTVYSDGENGILADGIYNLKLNCQDPVGNAGEEYVGEEMIIDHTAPEVLEITYSEPVLEKVIEKITFGYYNPTVTVMMKGRDNVSGIDTIGWIYKKEEGTSNINKEEDSGILSNKEVKQDTEDLSIFTAQVVLPGKEAEQLRGNISADCKDRKGNISDILLDDGTIIVVDTIAPTMKVLYSEPIQEVESVSGEKKAYYSGDITMEFEVTEANFYGEDVEIRLIKDGNEENPILISPTWNQDGEVYRATYILEALANHANDGDYVIKVDYMDRSGNAMEEYRSDIKVVDTICPEIRVAYRINGAEAKGALGEKRAYYNKELKATVSIRERNFNGEDVVYEIVTEDVSGNRLDAGKLHNKGTWTHEEIAHDMIIAYPGDANYSFDIAYTDLAGNKAEDYVKDLFTVDKTKPGDLSVKYSTSVLETVLSNVTFGFYNAPVTVTIQATDKISGVDSFTYGYHRAAGVSDVNAELTGQTITRGNISFAGNKAVATAVFTIPRGALDGRNQFNGTISFTAEDRSGNRSDVLSDTKRIVVDNISPTMTVSYNQAVSSESGFHYYDDVIIGTIVVNEANFYEEDVVIGVTKDGVADSLQVSWIHNSTDVHTGTFRISGDGEYVIRMNYKDKSQNAMQEYVSDKMRIDTVLEKPIITINGKDGDGKAYKDKAVLGISFTDTNFETYRAVLSVTSYADKDMDVTDKFLEGGIPVGENGGSASFDNFAIERKNDGIYRLWVEVTDKAGHVAEETIMFTLNRYGSVYEYNDYLMGLIADGGAYVQELEEDLVITEYNADRLVENSLRIEVSKDGKPVENLEYSVTPEMNSRVEKGTSGWYQYSYTIKKENFAGDGVYKLAVSSQDATGNTPETASFEDKNVKFYVDSTAPEINSITGLEKRVINATDVLVKYSVYDTMGLESVTVYVDDVVENHVTEFGEDRNSLTGEFTLQERLVSQNVRLVVTDLAGNITDTASEEFASVYEFNPTVTISTNFFIRWFANKAVFFGSIGGTAVLLTGGVAIVLGVLRRRSRG